MMSHNVTCSSDFLAGATGSCESEPGLWKYPRSHRDTQHLCTSARTQWVVGGFFWTVSGGHRGAGVTKNFAGLVEL